jgi:phage gp29-like protein
MYPNLFFVIGGDTEDRPVSFSACSVENGTCHVILCYTSPYHRRKGWFKLILDNLRKVDKSNPAYVWERISFGVMKHNKTMKTVMKCVEACERAIYYEVVV